MSATKILWGQIIVVFAIVLSTTWAATQWVAWKLGFQPQLGQPWFEIVAGVLIYLPPAFFWWWYAYDAYAPEVFVEGPSSRRLATSCRLRLPSLRRCCGRRGWHRSAEDRQTDAPSRSGPIPLVERNRRS